MSQSSDPSVLSGSGMFNLGFLQSHWVTMAFLSRLWTSDDVLELGKGVILGRNPALDHGPDRRPVT